MGLLGSMKAGASRFMNRDFANASMAMCALVTIADGEVDREEIDKTVEIIRTHPKLSAFDPQELANRYTGFLNPMLQDRVRGTEEAKIAMRKVSSNPEAALNCVAVGLAIAEAVGGIDVREKDAIREACVVMGVDQRGFRELD